MGAFLKLCCRSCFHLQKTIPFVCGKWVAIDAWMSSVIVIMVNVKIQFSSSQDVLISLFNNFPLS